MVSPLPDRAIHIGTSGWHYQHWKGNFYPARIASSDMLRYYAERFDTVELNSCFYKLPTLAAVKAWVRQTPAQFVFSLKASRYITHNRKLREPGETIARFFEMAKGFGNKLGPVLFQFPPVWQANPQRLAEFLSALPAKIDYAFEFRNPTWHTREIYRLLDRFNAALCIFDIAGYQSPFDLTAGFAYVRLHGPGKAYQGKYSPSTLRRWAKRIESWAAQDHRVYFYFDNDQTGFAAANAFELSRMLHLKNPVAA
jgi:uncharacterized protein YecE (DUF72 family)